MLPQHVYEEWLALTPFAIVGYMLYSKSSTGWRTCVWVSIPSLAWLALPITSSGRLPAFHQNAQLYLA